MVPALRAAMILCAGLGTRLRPLTDWLAKPMVPIGDRPAVAHIAASIRRAGIDRIIVNVHHRPDDVRSWAERENVLVSEERDVLLGTAGGVARASDLLGQGDILVWNGDILSDLDPRALIAAHTKSSDDGEIAATLAVVPRAIAGEGNVGLGEDGRIVRLRSESFAREVRGADFIGVHVLGGSLRRTLPERGCLVADAWIPALRRGDHLRAHTPRTLGASSENETSATFTDVGSIDAYVAANRGWLAARGASSWVAPDAIVRSDAHIDGSIIGASARIDADAIGCIVWPGAHVEQAIKDAIVTPHGIVSVSSILSASS